MDHVLPFHCWHGGVQCLFWQQSPNPVLDSGRVLSSLVGSWDSKGVAAQAATEAKTCVGKVRGGHGRGLPVGHEGILATIRRLRRGKQSSTNTVYSGGKQCGFHPGCGTLDQFYTLRRVLEGSWEFAQPVHMCFVGLEKAFDLAPRGILWEVLREYGVGGPLLRAVWSLYERSRSLIHFAGSKSDLFPVHVGLWQGWPLSPVLFIIFMDRIWGGSQLSVTQLGLESAPPSPRPWFSTRKRDPEEDPGHAGVTMSLGWPGNALGSSRKSWRKCLGRRKFGCPCSSSFPHNLAPDNAEEDGWIKIKFECYFRFIPKWTDSWKNVQLSQFYRRI